MLALVVQWADCVRSHGNTTGAEHMIGALWLFASVGLGMAVGRSSVWYGGLVAGALIYVASILLRSQVEKLGVRHAPRRG